MSLDIRDLHKRYGATRAVDGVSVEVAAAQTLALLGPSGCGKSTLLRLVAGLERPDSGSVVFEGTDITELPPQARGFGVVFQDFALFPHLDVAGNVGFGLVEQGVAAAARRARVAELLGLVGLDGYERRRVHQLSGGQQQRVALARALAPEPQVLLLDEPLSNLDEALRNELKDEIARILDELGVEAIYVTHDQAEAFAVADEVAVMREGRLIQVGDREALLEQPADAWTARFLGHENVWDGPEVARLSERLAVTGAAVPQLANDDALLLRADLVELSEPSTASAPADVGAAAQRTDRRPAKVAATVVRAEREALIWSLVLNVPAWGTKVRWRGHGRELPGHDAVAQGAHLELLVPDPAWHAIPGGNGSR